MTEWADPRIVIAISIGAGSFLLGVFNTYTNYRNHQRSQNQAAWDEYRDTVYNYLDRAIMQFEDQAKIYRKELGESPDGHAFFVTLSEALNEVESACARADRHDASVQKDWIRLAEERNQSIHDWITSYRDWVKARRQDTSTMPSLQDFHTLYRSYVEEIETRLREQRKSMLGF